MDDEQRLPMRDTVGRLPPRALCISLVHPSPRYSKAYEMLSVSIVFSYHVAVVIGVLTIHMFRSDVQNVPFEVGEDVAERPRFERGACSAPYPQCPDVREGSLGVVPVEESWQGKRRDCAKCCELFNLLSLGLVNRHMIDRLGQGADRERLVAKSKGMKGDACDMITAGDKGWKPRWLCGVRCTEDDKVSDHKPLSSSTRPDAHLTELRLLGDRRSANPRASNVSANVSFVPLKVACSTSSVVSGRPPLDAAMLWPPGSFRKDKVRSGRIAGSLVDGASLALSRPPLEPAASGSWGEAASISGDALKSDMG